MVAHATLASETAEDQRRSTQTGVQVGGRSRIQREQPEDAEAATQGRRLPGPWGWRVYNPPMTQAPMRCVTGKGESCLDLTNRFLYPPKFLPSCLWEKHGNTLPFSEQCENNKEKKASALPPPGVPQPGVVAVIPPAAFHLARCSWGKRWAR